MPNWVNNTLIIKGHARTVGKVETLLKNGEQALVLNNLLPCPEGLLNDDWQTNQEIHDANVAKYGVGGWYDWRVKYWGTKWDVADASFAKSKGEISYGFDTAWSPPCEWVAALSKRFPSLTITLEYHEEADLYPSAICTYEDGRQSNYKVIPNINLEEDEDED